MSSQADSGQNRSTYYSHSRSDIIPLLPEKCDRVLEIGCGRGNTLLMLREKLGCSWIGGIEINPDVLDEARQNLDFLMVGDFENLELPFEENSLDLVLCLDVLEHLADPWAALRKLYRYVRTGGSIIASIPNVRHVKVILPLLFKSRWEYVDDGILDRTHLRFFVRHSAIELIESGGFNVDLVLNAGLGSSRRSQVVNRMLPSFVTAFFVRQFMIRGVKIV